MVYRNVNGRFEDVTDRLGPPATTPKAGRGAAFGDIDNNGTIDVAINNVHDTPDLFLTKAAARPRWLLLRLVGTTSNRSAIGARVRIVTGRSPRCTRFAGGGSYLSQNDLRVHAGLGAAASADRIEVRWPNGLEELWENVASNQVLTLEEGRGKAMEAAR